MYITKMYHLLIPKNEVFDSIAFLYICKENNIFQENKFQIIPIFEVYMPYKHILLYVNLKVFCDPPLSFQHDIFKICFLLKIRKGSQTKDQSSWDVCFCSLFNILIYTQVLIECFNGTKEKLSKIVQNYYSQFSIIFHKYTNVLLSGINSFPIIIETCSLLFICLNINVFLVLLNMIRILLNALFSLHPQKTTEPHRHHYETNT